MIELLSSSRLNVYYFLPSAKRSMSCENCALIDDWVPCLGNEMIISLEWLISHYYMCRG